MAEIFGVVASTLSVAALFNNCVECFEYIQLGRQFEVDFARSQLQIDVCETRLSRWGQSVSINDTPAGNIPGEVQVRAILMEIARLYESARTISQKFQDPRVTKDGSLGSEKLGSNALKLHQRLGDICRGRRQSVGLLKKASWALYNAKHLSRLIDDMAEQIDNLEKLFPADLKAFGRQLVQTEIEEIEDEDSLRLLQEAATGVDTVLSDAADVKASQIYGIRMSGKNYAHEVRSEEQAKAQVGAHLELTLTAASGIADEICNSSDRVHASGSSFVRIGNEYVISEK